MHDISKNVMSMRAWVAFAIGLVAGAAVIKLFTKPRIVEVKVPIPQRCIPFSGPSMREVHRDPQRFGRRKIF